MGNLIRTSNDRRTSRRTFTGSSHGKLIQQPKRRPIQVLKFGGFGRRTSPTHGDPPVCLCPNTQETCDGMWYPGSNAIDCECCTPFPHEEQ
jgi:hypothetical protein